MKYLVHLDSRQSSTKDNAGQCMFQLSQAIVGARECRVISFTFANFLFNVAAPNNTFVFSNFVLTVPDGHYTLQALLDQMNSIVTALPAFTDHWTPGTHAPFEVVAGQSDVVLFTLGSNVLQGGGLYPVFGLSGQNTGSFFGLADLAQPTAIGLSSSSLQAPDTLFVTTYPAPAASLFHLQHLSSVYGEVEPPENSMHTQSQIRLSSANLTQIAIEVVDPANLRVLREIGPWSLLLEIRT